MSLLFPLYLLGAAAIAIPILLHLRRKPPTDHVPFSSLMFLEKSPERLTRRTRIERWVLLALRCLALMLLAFMFGRPFLSSDVLSEMDDLRRVVILVDRSASMRREDLWEQAIEKAGKLIEETGQNDAVSVAWFDNRVEFLSGGINLANPVPEGMAMESWDRELNRLGPGWRATHLGDALIAAADLIGDAETDRVYSDTEIVVISDFQEGLNLKSLNQYAWPGEVAVRCVAVAPEDPGNLAIHLVASPPAEGDPEDTKRKGGRRRVRMSNARDSREEDFSLGWEAGGGEVMHRMNGKLPPGGSRVLIAPERPDQPADGVLVVEGDTHDFDNRLYVARSQPREVRILFLSEDKEPAGVGSPFFYLSRAMHQTATIDPSVRAMSYGESADAFEEAVADSQVVVFQGNPGEEVAARLSDLVMAGGLVMGVISRETEGAALDAILKTEGVELSEAEVKDYAMLAQLDFEHPVLRPFAKAKVRDFTKVRTWKHRRLVLPELVKERTRIFARFDSGDPAWLEVGMGEGRVFLFLSGWEPSESQLALSSKFVPLMYAILGQAGFSVTEEKTILVGEELPLASDVSRVRFPDGREAERSAPVIAEEPGIYAGWISDGSERNYAVNLSPAESRTDTIDPAVALGALGVRVLRDSVSSAREPASEAEEKQQRRLQAAEREGLQKLWKYLLLAVLAILMLETWLAGRRASGGGTRIEQG